MVHSGSWKSHRIAQELPQALPIGRGLYKSQCKNTPPKTGKLEHREPNPFWAPAAGVPFLEDLSRSPEHLPLQRSTTSSVCPLRTLTWPSSKSSQNGCAGSMCGSIVHDATLTFH